MALAKNALHVDDDGMMVKMVRSVLERAGYQVSSARSGDEALRSLVSVKPQIIILDVNIGPESGYDLCRVIREIGMRAPIVFLTANRTMEDVRAAREVGGDYFIVKPFTPASLLAGIDKATAVRQKSSQIS